MGLLLFGIMLLIVGGLLGYSGATPLALGCLALGALFCVAGLGVRRARR
ncbi:MAG: hypothetical protein H7Z42_22110 [Roseiflexaceae bacterium]|nr:hypothetical protein [Roseiflexaceae bacterium]